MVMCVSWLLWSLSFDSGFHIVSCESNIVVPVRQQLDHFISLSSRALMATITLLADINTAPRAGVSSTPHA
jgi:hypothetical protein